MVVSDSLIEGLTSKAVDLWSNNMDMEYLFSRFQSLFNLVKVLTDFGCVEINHWP